LDELYDERGSTDMTEAGVSDDPDVIGDLEMPFACDDNVRVSSVNEELLTLLLANFFDDGWRRRKTDFHECELGLGICGEVGVCILGLMGDRAWAVNDCADGMERGGRGRSHRGAPRG
jgi:hypothetical protein